VLVCQPLEVNRGPFRDLPHKLPCEKDLLACRADGKLHTQPHTGRVRLQFVYTFRIYCVWREGGFIASWHAWMSCRHLVYLSRIIYWPVSVIL